MKRILILLLVLTLALTAFASCEYIPSEVMDKISPILDKVGINTGKTEEPTPDETPETPAVDADLKAAYDYIHQMTKDIAEVTGANYTVFTSAKIGEKTYQVKWEVNVDSITITPNEDGVTATVNVPSKTYVDIPYTLKFTVTNEKGETLSREYKHVVPEFKVNTHAEYLAAENGTNLVIKGVVVAINAKSAGNTRNHLFLADEDVVGGYYIYQMEADPTELGIQVGMTVLVTGPATPYNGMMEIKGGVAEIIDTTIKTVEPVDITAAYTAGEDLGKYVGLPVTIKGVTIGGQKLGGSSDYLYFTLNGKEAYLRSYKTDFPTTLPASAKEVIEAAHAAHYNWTADVTGILVLYSGAPYIIPMTEDCFTYLAAQELTDAEKVADSLNNITLPGDITADTTVELPLTGKNYSEVTFTWTVDSTDFNIGADGKMPVTLGSSAVTLKLTVTAKCGETTDTKEFTVNVAASLIMNEKHAYASYINQVKNGTVLYLDGGVDGRYLTTTTDPSKGVAVYAEQATGGYKLYILVDGAKQYITIYTNADGKTSVHYDAAGETVYTYNKTVNAWTTVFGGKDVYLGTYNNFATISVSDLSYITAENTGVSQFPLEILDVAVNAPINMFVNQVKNGTVVYLNGGVSGRYLTTSANIADAVAVYAEKVTGGYKFYILDGETKQYITIYNNAEGKTSVNYDAAGETVYTYNPTVNAWTTVFGGKDVYLGTYNNFETISVSDLSYINADNTGVSQFPLDVVAGTPAPAPSCEHTNVTTTTVDPTCVAAGSTTVTCNDCGETVSTTAIDATGVHTYVDGACSVCGVAETHVHTPITTTFASTCTTAGYTVEVCEDCEVELGERTALPLKDHADENGDYKCDACSATVLPADGTALTITEAIAVANAAGSAYSTQKYYVTGIVTNVYNTTYGNLYLKDSAGNQICIYGLYTWDKAVRYDKMEYKPVEGDELTVYTVLGMYNTTAQGKDAWIDEVVAHEHNYTSQVTEPTCTQVGYTTHTCSICNGSKVDTEVDALGHTTEEGVCERCGNTIGGDAPAEPQVLATFEFGANGTASHNDGGEMSATQKYTHGTYTLSFDSVTKVYSGARDAKGNSCLKFGTSKVIGSLTFTVAEDVDEVVIYVAKYKSNNATISINGTNYTLTKNSDNGEYDVIRIDTSVNKTVTIATVASTYRCMINTIEFVG